MTANGTTHTTEEATVYVCDLDMFVQVQVLKESPAVLWLGKLWKQTASRLIGTQVSHSISSRMGETLSVKPTTTSLWLS